jgi:hypothetical protein
MQLRAQTAQNSRETDETARMCTIIVHVFRCIETSKHDDGMALSTIQRMSVDNDRSDHVIM